MKKFAASVLDLAIVLLLTVPVALLAVLRGAYWCVEKSTDALERFRDRCGLDDVAGAGWIADYGEWLVKDR